MWRARSLCRNMGNQAPTPEVGVRDLPGKQSRLHLCLCCFLWKCHCGLNIQDYNYTGNLNTHSAHATQTKDHTIKGIHSHTGTSEHLDWHKGHGGLQPNVHILYRLELNYCKVLSQIPLVQYLFIFLGRQQEGQSHWHSNVYWAASNTFWVPILIKHL